MKKLFFAVVALAMVATSCSKDESVAPEATAKTFTFTVKAPVMQTRAEFNAGTGAYADKLYYAFYDETGAMLTAVDGGEKGYEGVVWDGLEGTTVEVTLVEGKEYTALFWAQNSNDPHGIDMETKTVEIFNEGLNAEQYDAFYAHVAAFKPESLTDEQKNIELKRPFAQVNIGAPTTDVTAAANAGFPVSHVWVEMAGVGDSINLATGEVTPESGKVTSLMSSVGTATKTFESVQYTILATKYVLVGNADKELSTVDFYMNETNSMTNAVKRSWSAVPIEVNHRTFILGNVVTSANPLTYNIIIVPGFDNEANPTIHK